MTQRRVVAVIGARLNSSRLPGKQLLDLAGKPMIERLFNRLETVPEIDRTVLATTADSYNEPLVTWAETHQRAVFAYPGDVNDLMGRVDAVVEQEQADLLIYVCGDSPLVEPTTLSRLIQAMLADELADSATLPGPPDGLQYIHEGFDLYSRAYWKEIMALSTKPEEREHVGYARTQLQRDPVFAVAEKESPIFYRMKHRISVDTPSDYQFMKTVYRRWYRDHPADSIVSLSWVVEQLSDDETLRAINQNVEQKRAGEEAASALLVTEVGTVVGLGHLRRTVVVARALQDYAKAKVEVVVVGERAEFPWMALLPQQWMDDHQQLFDYLDSAAEHYGAMVFDLVEREETTAQLQSLLERNQTEGRLSIAIDGLASLHAYLDLIWYPSYYLPPRLIKSIPQDKRSYGWDHYLLSAHNRCHDPGKPLPGRVLVLLGGSDPDQLGEQLPALLQQHLPESSEVIWVQGPYADAPNLDEVDTLDWVTHHAPESLLPLYHQCDLALVSYGVSLFELLAYGMPTVALATRAGPEAEEWVAFQQEQVALTVDNPQQAAEQVGALMQQPALRQELHQSALQKIDMDGAKRFVDTFQKHYHARLENEPQEL